MQNWKPQYLSYKTQRKALQVDWIKQKKWNPWLKDKVEDLKSIKKEYEKKFKVQERNIQEMLDTTKGTNYVNLVNYIYRQGLRKCTEN